jgi:beta-glucanase (GH16 family)
MQTNFLIVVLPILTSRRFSNLEPIKFAMSYKQLIVSILACPILFNCNDKKSQSDPSDPPTPSQPLQYQLVWNDEFDYTGLPDPAKWNYDVGGDGWGNHELEFYTDHRAGNARAENGNLVIEAIKEPWQGKDYTSARLLTKGKGDWQYGKIEVRAKLPKGVGTWPAIWMLGSTTPLKWPDDGEIDIMEHVGFDQGLIHGTIHCKAFNHVIGTQRGDSIRVNDCSDSFHVYGLEWNKDSVRVSVDGNDYFDFTNQHTGYDAWPFDNKMFLILNIAVGGDWGGQQGVDTTIWPQKMEIDYVRVYQLK